jgi:hypothetical protein
MATVAVAENYINGRLASIKQERRYSQLCKLAKTQRSSRNTFEIQYKKSKPP